MELYNFFSETIQTKDKLSLILSELKQVCHFVELVEFKSRYLEYPEYTIIGQMYGDDTNVGDLDLLAIMGDIQYSWIDARLHKINNLEDAK